MLSSSRFGCTNQFLPPELGLLASLRDHVAGYILRSFYFRQRDKVFFPLLFSEDSWKIMLDINCLSYKVNLCTSVFFPTFEGSYLTFLLLPLWRNYTFNTTAIISLSFPYLQRPRWRVVVISLLLFLYLSIQIHINICSKYLTRSVQLVKLDLLFQDVVDYVLSFWQGTWKEG